VCVCVWWVCVCVCVVCECVVCVWFMCVVCVCGVCVCVVCVCVWCECVAIATFQRSERFSRNFAGISLCTGVIHGPSQLPRGLRGRSTAARLLRLWVRIPPWAWISLWCECYVLSGRGLCDELFTRPQESYRRWCVVVCDIETS